MIESNANELTSDTYQFVTRPTDMDDLQAGIVFIENIKAHPILYDISLDRYPNKAEQDRAWILVSEAVNLSVAACKEKWKNLRAGLSRHLRNQHAQPFNEPGAKPKRPYYLAEHMDFLIPFCKPRKQVAGNYVQVHEGDSYECMEDSFTEEYDEPARGGAGCSTDHTSGYEGAQNGTVNGGPASPLQNKVKRKWNHRDPVEKCAVEYLVADDGHGDADLNFLRSLLPDMKLMNRQQRNRFKIAVINAIDSVLNSEDESGNR